MNDEMEMEIEMAETPAPARASRFREHTNTNSSIRPPPDELWKDLGIEKLIEEFNEENQRPAVRRKVSDKGNGGGEGTAGGGGHTHTRVRVASETRAPGIYEASTFTSGAAGPVFGVPSSSVATTGTATPAATGERTLGRIHRALASVFGNVLGKRKAGSVDAEKDKDKKVLDERKRTAEAAYQEAKELGLLPTPKVFVRPGSNVKSHKCVTDTATPIRTPRTPTLYRTPSKKDLHKQKKLLRRVSNLEDKLASARKELQTVLHNDDDLPPVPALPTLLPPTPNTSQSDTEAPSLRDPVTPVPSTGKITKKRKATTDEGDLDFKPIPTDSDADELSLSAASEPERTVKRVKSTASSRNKNAKTKSSSSSSSARLQKRRSRGNEEVVVTVVPDGVDVPLIPDIPRGVRGRKVKVRVEGDDGYGGLEHEMF